MRSVVLDTSITLQGLASPSGLARKFLVLAAYGSVCTRIRVLGDEQKMLKAQAQGHPGAVLGGTRWEERLTDLREKRGSMGRHLAHAPDDICLVSSSYLLDEFERNLVKSRSRIGFLSPAAARRMRLIYSALCISIVREFQLEKVPKYTEGRDPRDDPVIHTAIVGRAGYLVSKDKSVSLYEDDVTLYQAEGLESATCAVRLEYFVENHVNTSSFTLGEVSGELLKVAFG